MTRNLIRLVTILGLLVSSLGISATPALSGVAVIETAESCKDGNVVSILLGEAKQAADLTTDGARAYIDPTAGWNSCTTASDNDNGPAIWVGVQGAGGVANAIIQVGVGECEDPAPPPGSACDGTNRFWYAYGGCNGATPWPRNLGTAGLGAYIYEVFESGSQWIVRVLNTSGGVITSTSIAESSPSINCWINGNSVAVYDGELWDDGDSLGVSNTNYSRLYSATYRATEGGAWTGTSFAGSCNFSGDNGGENYHQCNVQSASELRFWSL